MSIKFYSKDLPAARAYIANQLSSAGYENEADIIRKDTDLHLDTNTFVYTCITRAAAKLKALWAPLTGTKAPARQVPSTDMPGL